MTPFYVDPEHKQTASWHVFVQDVASVLDLTFYRMMHYSAQHGLAIACFLSVYL